MSTCRVTRARLPLALSFALLAAAVTSGEANAAVFTATKTADTADGACDADCSLREAILAANAREGEDVVVLAPGLYVLTRPGAGEDGASLGDLDVTDDLALIGAGAGSTILDGGTLDRVLHVAAGASLEALGITIRNGRVAGAGGGVLNQGVLSLTRSVVSGNATLTGGFGGGISSEGDLALSQSTVAGNTADGGGGGIAADGSLTLTNVTVSGNRSTTGSGGGLYLFENLEAEIANNTITGNAAAVHAGGVLVLSTPFITVNFPELRNTILAGNSAPQSRDCAGAAVSAGHNLIGDGSDCLDFRPALGDLEGTTASPLNPSLGPLTGNGGPTPTHALLPGNPAVDAGSPAAPGSSPASCADVDQRGEPRPGFDRCDIGAYELTAGCVPGSSTLCLNQGRFQVTVVWLTRDGASGNGQAQPLTDDSGYFWFFDPANVELVVKALDACTDFDRFWVFASGLTNVEVRIQVVDTATGVTKTYVNPQGTTFQTRLDTNAFDTCP